MSRMEGRLAKAAARALDHGLARTGLPRPLLLVTGFWRSGTTTLQQALARSLRAKPVFEPLSARIPEYLAQVPSAGLTHDDREAYMPDLDAGGASAALWRYLDDAYAGYCPGHFALLTRERVVHSLRTDVIVKCVRAAFGQRALHARYGMPVVHIRRHPCAVVASLLQTDTWTWDFANVTLPVVLAHIARSPAETAELQEIAGRHDGDALSRIAAYWALTERYAQRALAGQDWAWLVDYEAAVNDPQATIGAIATALGRAVPRVPATSDDSPVTEPSRRGAPRAARTDGWRATLPAAEIERVLEIVAAILPDGLDPARCIQPGAQAPPRVGRPAGAGGVPVAHPEAR
jgi:hypothetical protein